MRHLYPIAFCLLLLPFCAPSSAALQVVTSIKPVDDLVRAVMEGVGAPVLLIPPGSSPHVYALKPSERLALDKAAVLFWVGPQVETSLAKVSRTMRPDSRLVALSKAPGIELLPTRASGNWNQHEAGPSHRHGQHDPADEGYGFDGHLWLSPRNAAVIVRAAAATLAEADSANAARYAANAEKALKRLAALDVELGARIAPVRDKPFIVFHDAYQYFEKSYRLAAVGSIVVSPEAMSSAGRVRALRARIVGLGAVCVFAEPQFEPRLLQTLVEDTRARTGILDPLGAGLPSGMAGYEQLLGNLAKNLAECLGK